MLKLIMSLGAKLGYSISYDEVQHSKQSLAVHSYSKAVSSNFSQWVADNCDHNEVTLDGKGVFHLMGIIECGWKHIRQIILTEHYLCHYLIIVQCCIQISNTKV